MGTMLVTLPRLPVDTMVHQSPPMLLSSLCKNATTDAAEMRPNMPDTAQRSSLYQRFVQACSAVC